MKEFEHPHWTAHGAEARAAGHEGAGLLPGPGVHADHSLGYPPPIDAADAAAWSVIIPLSAKSIAEGGAPQEIPTSPGGSGRRGRRERRGGKGGGGTFLARKVPSPAPPPLLPRTLPLRREPNQNSTSVVG